MLETARHRARSRAARRRPGTTNSGAIRWSGLSRVSRTSRRMRSLRRSRRGPMQRKAHTAVSNAALASRAAIASARAISRRCSRPRRRPPGQAPEAPRSWSGQSTTTCRRPLNPERSASPESAGKVSRARWRAESDGREAMSMRAPSRARPASVVCRQRAIRDGDVTIAPARSSISRMSRRRGRRAATTPAHPSIPPPRANDRVRERRGAAAIGHDVCDHVVSRETRRRRIANRGDARDVLASTARRHSGRRDDRVTARALVKRPSRTRQPADSVEQWPRVVRRREIVVVGHHMDSRPQRLSACASGPSGPSSRVLTTIGGMADHGAVSSSAARESGSTRIAFRMRAPRRPADRGRATRRGPAPAGARSPAPRRGA